jgi:hypothetical protein
MQERVHNQVRIGSQQMQTGVPKEDWFDAPKVARIYVPVSRRVSETDSRRFSVASAAVPKTGGFRK